MPDALLGREVSDTGLGIVEVAAGSSPGEGLREREVGCCVESMGLRGGRCVTVVRPSSGWRRKRRTFASRSKVKKASGSSAASVLEGSEREGSPELIESLSDGGVSLYNSVRSSWERSSDSVGLRLYRG